MSVQRGYSLSGRKWGELVAFRVTTGEVNDQVPVGRMARGLWGQLFGDRGYISRALHKMLWAQGLALTLNLSGFVAA
jgi:hypothetical protein